MQKEYFSEYKTPTQIYLDGGSEFKGELLEHMKDLKVKIIVTTQHAPFIESFNRTIRNIISRWMKATGHKDWWTVLSAVIHNYNNSIHTTTKFTPVDAMKEKNKDEVLNNILLKAEVTPMKEREKFDVGDNVRTILQKGRFSKETESNYSDEIYKIEKYENPYYYLEGKRKGFLRNGLKRIKYVEVFEKPESVAKGGVSRVVEPAKSIAMNRARRETKKPEKLNL